jgi:Ca-activated chloride channel family protein
MYSLIRHASCSSIAALVFLLNAGVDAAHYFPHFGKPAGADSSLSNPQSLTDAGGRQTVGRPGTTIRIDVALVTVPVLVTDRNGNPLTNLAESDFRIYENNAVQTIARLIPEGEPFHVALMVDRSGSTHFKSGEIQDAAIAFIRALGPEDRVLVVSFDDELHVDADFTGERSRLDQAVRRIQEAGGRTGLYDAIKNIVARRLSRLAGRKAIVLFTDGVDNGSREAGAADTLASVQQSDVIVYAIQYDTTKDRIPDRFQVPLPAGYPSFKTLYSRGVRYLSDLTRHSGGRLYQAQTPDTLTTAFRQIADELRRQYTVCYYPANQERDGSLRRIRVTVSRPDVIIHARTSYRAAKEKKEDRP